MYLIWQSHGNVKTYDFAIPKIRKKINKQVGYVLNQMGIDPQPFKGAARFADAHWYIYGLVGRCPEFEKFEILRNDPNSIQIINCRVVNSNIGILIK